MENNNKTFSIKKRIKSFGYAIKGIKVLITTQHNAWIHLLATITVIIAGIILKITVREWFMIIIAVSLVWITEALNTAIEFMIDMIQPDYHPLAEKAKDIAAAAVLIASITAIVIGVIVFLPKFI